MPATKLATKQLHDWFDPHEAGFKALKPGVVCCRRCGVIRASDGSSDAKACRGIVKVALR